MRDLMTRPGVMTRRGALLAFTASVMSPRSMAQPVRPVIRTRRLNNVMISVSNLERSTAFHEKLFGPPVRQGDTVIFRVGDGPHFFALRPVRDGDKPDFLSYGMTVVDFDAEEVKRTLAGLGISAAEIIRRGDTTLFGLIPWDPAVLPVVGSFLLLGVPHAALRRRNRRCEIRPPR